MKNLFLLLSCALLCNHVAYAQETPPAQAASIVRKDLLSAQISPARSLAHIEVKQVKLPARQSAPLHLHPCPVTGTVLEGRIAFQIEGEAVHHLVAGDAFYEPANARIARFDNEGDSPATFTAIYLMDENEKEFIRILSK